MRTDQHYAPPCTAFGCVKLKLNSRFQNPGSVTGMHKHVHWKATYRLSVHQFTTQQVGKGGKRNEFSLNIKSTMSMHKHVHSMATYFLIVHQFTTQQVGKGGKRNEFHSIQNEYAQTCSFKGNLRPESAQRSKWVKEVKETNFHSTQNQYAQPCSFKGNLQSESAPVHNAASG